MCKIKKEVITKVIIDELKKATGADDNIINTVQNMTLDNKDVYCKLPYRWFSPVICMMVEYWCKDNGVNPIEFMETATKNMRTVIDECGNI